MSDTDATQARQDVVADVDEILEHVINANMLSMPYDVYFELFDAVGGLGVKVEKLQAENAKLRELVRGLWYCAHEAYGMCARVPVGGERPFTCCPLYDYDSKVYRCEKLILELGIEVD